MTALSDSLTLPLDRVRTALFVRATRVRALRPLLLRKERRIPALLLAHAGVALVAAILAPTCLLVAGPLLLGVPHLIADVRYLVLRPSLPRGARRWLLLGSLGLLAARLLEESRVIHGGRLELGLAGVLVLGALWLARGAGRRWRVTSAALVTLALVGAALRWPVGSRVLVGHGHNLVALVLWAALYARRVRGAVFTGLIITALALVLVLSPLAWWGFVHGAPQAFGLHAFAAADNLAPGIVGAPLALGIVASFAFLQSVHYAVWLHAIPQAATRGDATLSFRMSARALRADLGGVGAWLALSLVLLVPLAGLSSPLPTKALYLSLSTFHGYLELAVAALWFASGERAVAAASTATTAAAS